MLRVINKLLVELDWLTGIMIKPLLFCLLIEINYLILKGIDVAYDCY